MATLLMALKQAEADGYRVAYWRDYCDLSCTLTFERLEWCRTHHGPHDIAELIAKQSEESANQYTYCQGRIWCTWYDKSRSQIIYTLQTIYTLRR